MFNGLNNGLYNGNLLVHANGLNGESAGYCKEANDLFEVMRVKPIPSRKKSIDRCIKSLIEEGIWTELDALWMPASHSEDTALLNWKSPTQYKLTAFNSPTFREGLGYKGNGSNSYLKTNLTPANCVKYSTNSGFFGVYSRSNLGVSATICMGYIESSSVQTYIFPTFGGGVFSRFNSSSGSTSAVYPSTNSIGLLSSRRTGSAQYYSGKNGAESGSTATTSAIVGNREFFLLAVNDQGTPGNYWAGEISTAFIGSGIINPISFNSIIQSHLSDLRANTQ